MRELTNHDLKQALRNKYAWPGGYELFGITSDGAVLCCDCMRKNFRNILDDRRQSYGEGDWNILAIDSSASLNSTEFCNEHFEEYALTQCNQCNKTLNG